MNLDIPLRDSKIYSVRGKILYCEIKRFYDIFCNNIVYLNRFVHVSLANLNMVFRVLLWLRFHILNAGDPGSIPGQGTRSHMLQLRPRATKEINFKKISKCGF